MTAYEGFGLIADGETIRTATATNPNSTARTVTAGANNTLTGDGGQLKITLGGTNASIVSFGLDAPTTSRTVVRIAGFRMLNGGVSFRPLVFRTVSGNAGNLAMTTGNQLQIIDGSGSTVIPGSVSAALTPGTTYDIEAAITVGADTSTGALEYRYYLAGSSTPVESFTFTGVNAGTLPVETVRLGTSNVPSGPQTYWIDSVEAVAVASGWLGPAPFTVALTADARGEPGQTLTLTASGGTLAAVSVPALSFTRTTGGFTAEPPLSFTNTTYRISVTGTQSNRVRDAYTTTAVLGCEESMMVDGVHQPTVVYF